MGRVLFLRISRSQVAGNGAVGHVECWVRAPALPIQDGYHYLGNALKSNSGPILLIPRGVIGLRSEVLARCRAWKSPMVRICGGCDGMAKLFARCGCCRPNMLFPFIVGPIGLLSLLFMGLSKPELSGSPRLGPGFSDCVLSVIDGAPLIFNWGLRFWNPDM